MSEIKKVASKRGPKKRTLVTTLRSQLWVNELCRLTGSFSTQQAGVKSFYELDKKFESFTHNNSSDYNSGASGVAPNTMKLIDREFQNKNPESTITISSFYDIGPIDADETHCPLWDALAGPIEGLWEVLFWYDAAVELQHEMGLSFRTKINLLVARLFNRVDPPEEWFSKSKPNCVAEAYRNGEIMVDMHLFVAVIAAWRLANFMNDSKPLLNYMMVGILDKAAKDLLAPLGIYENFKRELVNIDTPQVQRFNDVIDRFNENYEDHLKTYPEEARMELVGVYEYFRVQQQGTRVSEYLNTMEGLASLQ